MNNTISLVEHISSYKYKSVDKYEKISYNLYHQNEIIYLHFIQFNFLNNICPFLIIVAKSFQMASEILLNNGLLLDSTNPLLSQY